ncbi:MAG TPA: carbon-nitrogen hydrolase family protein [Candidatus Didemnitutus sp.]|jgi:predicted amidohydrolase
MNLLRVLVSTVIVALGAVTALNSATAPVMDATGYISHADGPPRKVVVATVVADISGSVDARLQFVGRSIDRAAREAAVICPGRGLDLVVFPEFAICRETGVAAAERAVILDGPVSDAIGSKAREHRTWLVVPMTLQETDRISNAAVLFDRAGKVAGIFRKVHPVADDAGVLEGGVTPGAAYPVFDCDFGRLGILVCWDMAYDEGWDALAAGGAEIVALTSASPQTLRPSSQALRHHFYVVTSTPRDNASVFDPIGRTIAQATDAPGVAIREIDLAFAILHWSEGLREGHGLTDRYGSRVGGTYSTREDTGVFWSNDPTLPIGAMIREVGLREMPDEIARMEAAAKRRRPETTKTAR